MHAIDQAFEGSGGFLRRRDLLRLGLTDHDIRMQRAHGGLERIRQGWYADPRRRPSPLACAAVRVGGRLGGFAALETYGVWVPQGHPVCITVPRHARRLRSPDDPARRFVGRFGGQNVVVRWTARPITVDVETWRTPVADALVEAMSVATREDAVIVADSCLQLGLVSWPELETHGAQLSRSRKTWLRLVDARAESGGESAVRLRLADAGIAFEAQPEVPGIGHLDGRIGNRTFVEIDGYSAHGDRRQFERDHDRGLVAELWGLRVVRLSSHQVFNAWPLCLAAIQAAIAADRVDAPARPSSPPR